MYRVITCLVLAIALPGCSLGRQSLSLDYANDASSTASIPRASRAPVAGALGGEPRADRSAPRAQVKGTQVARLDDRAPTGTYEKAPRGSLADRDYTGTRLDPEKARDIINLYRSEKGLKPLKLNAKLTEAAKAHSRDLAKWDRISHFGSDGSNPWDRVKRAGYNARLAAENVGTGQIDLEEVVKGWKQSPGHNKNLLLRDADHMGIALVQDPKTEFKTFWTLVLGTSM